jgi:hypothetical protein
MAAAGRAAKAASLLCSKSIPKRPEALERQPFWRVQYLRSWLGVSSVFGDPEMDRRDQELLDKQLRHVQIAPRNDGVLMLALLAVFFTGMALGGFFYAYAGAPTQIAAKQAALQQVASNNVPILVPQGTARQ